MDKRMKNLRAVLALGAATLMTYSIATLAASSQMQALQMPAQHAKMLTVQPAKIIRIHKVVKIEKLRKPSWRLGLARNKHLSADDARILTKAALLMHNRHDLHVGKIETRKNAHDKTFYLIQIVNEHNKVISLAMLNSHNGHIRPAILNK